MGNQPAKSKSRLVGNGLATHAKSTTGVDFQNSLRKYQSDQSEYQYLSTITHFDENTLRLLHARFTVIDQAMQEDGYISLEEFAQILAMPRESLLLKRFFKFMDKSDMGTLNFRNFVDTMSKLSIDASLEDKVDLSFFLYDINQDGFIDRTECKQMVQAALEQIEMQLSEKQIDQIVENTFNVTDTNNDNLIDKQEYAQYCKKNPRILQSFQVDISNLIQYEHESRRVYHRYSNSMELKRTLHHGPNHSPNTDGKFFAKKMPKLKNPMKKKKVERVRSIHNADQIMADGDSDQWGSEENSATAYDRDESVTVTKSNTLQHREVNFVQDAEDSIDPSQMFRKAKSADISKLQRKQYPSQNTLSSTANFLAGSVGAVGAVSVSASSGSHGGVGAAMDRMENATIGTMVGTPTLSQTNLEEDDSPSGSSDEEKFDNSNNNNNMSNIGNNGNERERRESKDSRDKSSKKMKRSRSPFGKSKDKKERKKSRSRGRKKSKSPSNSPDNDTVRQKSNNNSLSLTMPRSGKKSKSKPT